MAERKNAGRVQATPLRGYDARRRELVDAFNLPEGTREWVTVRYDPDHPDEAQRYTLSVCATAGRTSTVVALDPREEGSLAKVLKELLDDNREELHRALKLDLATNLMAMSTLRGDE